MREILFRGKRSDNLWEYGNLTMIGGNAFISNGLAFFKTVDTNTVGQYTGLADTNGRKIFEGDIVKCRHEIPHIDLYPEKQDIRPRRSYGHEIGYENPFYNTGAYLEYWRNYEVKYNDKGGYMLNNGSDRHKLYNNYIRYHEIEVIGNIYDNPELLKGE